MPLLLLLLPHVGTIPGLALFLPLPPHLKPSRRAPLSKKARNSSLGESSSSRLQKPQSPTNQGPARALPLDPSPALIIRRPYFHYNPIPGNTDCSARDLHDEVHYDLPAFAEDLELRDSMRLVQRYFLEPFMTPHRFFYPRMVIEFYHTKAPHNWSRKQKNSKHCKFCRVAKISQPAEFCRLEISEPAIVSC